MPMTPGFTLAPLPVGLVPRLEHPGVPEIGMRDTLRCRVGPRTGINTTVGHGDAGQQDRDGQDGRGQQTET